MKNKLKLMIIFCIVIVMSSFITVNAQSTTVTASGGSVNSQEEIEITLTSSVSLQGYTISVIDAGDCTFKSASVPSNVNGSPNGSTIGGVSSEGTITLATYKFTAPSVTEDKNSTIKFSISGILSANDEELEDTSCTASITIKAPDQTPDTSTPDTSTTTPSTDNTQTDTPTTTTPVEQPKSSEARLSNLGIKPNDFTGFKKNQTEYTAEVPNTVTEVEVYTKKEHPNSTVEGLGNLKLNSDGKGTISLKEGNNEVQVKVTAEDGKTTKTYKLTIKRRTEAEEAAVTSEARLSNLEIKQPAEYDFSGFEKDKTEYTAEVPNEVEEIEVYAKAVDPKAQITGTGMIELKEGENIINIEVIAQNGTKKTYTLKVTRKAAEKTEEPDEIVDDEEKFGLSTLTITGLTLNEKFNTGTYEYSIDLTEDLASLPISVKSTDKDATVEIIGNENLQPGENIITILVQNAETEEVATYQIIVNKNVVEEETTRTSWLKPSTWGKEEIIKIAMVVVIIILIIIAVILKIQIAKDNKEEKKVEFPGADALDKALAEHQELSTDEQIDGEKVGENNYIEEIAMNNAENEVIEEQQEAFAISEATKGEVKRFLEEFPQEDVQEEIQEVNENVVETPEEERRVTVDDLFNNDDFDGRPRRRKGKHF